ncbi:MAG: hypothetical protein GTO22_02245, partial [Gemmatimonadales bacterium]|nr:hypothetical protein [Gemmatimonadales bacterium]
GNLLNVSNVRVGTISYTTGEIIFAVLETLSLNSDYATANVFQIEFDDSIDHDANGGTPDRLGILQAGRDDPATDGGLPTNESGSNVLVITYDVQLSDDWQPDEELTNQVALESYATTDGAANLIVGSRRTDIATVEGRDVEVDKFLMATNHEHTGVFSVFDEDGGLFGVVQSTLDTPETVTLAQQNIVPGSLQLSFPGSENYIVDLGNRGLRTVQVSEAFDLVDDGFGNLVNTVNDVGYQGWSHYWNWQLNDRGLPLNQNTVVWGAADGHNNIIPGTWTFNRQDLITDYLDDPAGIDRNVTSYAEITIDSVTGAIVASPTTADIQTTGGLLLKQVDRELYGIPFTGYGFLGTSQLAGTVFNLLEPPGSDPDLEGYYDQSLSTLYLDSRLSPGSITLDVNIGGVDSTLTDLPSFSAVSIGDDAATFNTGTGVLLDGVGDVIANINYATGEVVFIQAEAPLYTLIASYESYLATIDYEDGDLNDVPNYLSNNVFNPDGQFGDHNNFGDSNYSL